MTAPARMRTLNARQQRVLELIGQGMTDAEIADRLYISVTVAWRVVLEIREKLGARNRAHAVALGYRAGILS